MTVLSANPVASTGILSAPHMPSDEILLKYVSGALDPALRALVDRHFELKPASRAALQPWGHFAGSLLAAQAPANLTPGSLDRILAKLESRSPAAPAPHPGFPPPDQMRWRWAGAGRAIANIDIPGSRLKSYALRIAPGKAMLQHSHAAEEWTLIIQGAYRDEAGDYGTGAFIEEDTETNHRPVAIGHEECICLVVMSGPLSAPGWLGKAAQWLMG